MITGVNPGKHGIYGFTMVYDDYRNVPIEPMSNLGALPLGRILNDHGISTGIINLPILYPPEPVQGYLVCGMLTPWTAKVFTYPASLSQTIGDPRQNWIIGESLSRDESLEKVLVEIREKTKRQVDLTLRLLNEFETEFLMVVFDGSDKVQHFFWKYWDTAHPGHQPQASEVLRSAIPEYYKNLDTHLAKILERFNESNVFVVSDHGFNGISQGLYIEQWLLQEGYLHLRSPMVTASNRILGNAFRGMWQTVSRLQDLKGKVKSSKVLGRLAKKTKETFYDRGMSPSDYIDWSKTKVFLRVVPLGH